MRLKGHFKAFMNIFLFIFSFSENLSKFNTNTFQVKDNGTLN